MRFDAVLSGTTAAARNLNRRDALLAMACLAAGCNKSPTAINGLVSLEFGDGRASHKRPEERTADPIWDERYNEKIRRTVLSCPAGDCFLLHYPPRFHKFPDGLTDALLKGDPQERTDDALLVSPGGLWDDWVLGPSNSFNCCTFAVGDLVGLTVNDWLDGQPSPFTDDTNPMDVILKSYFEQIRNYDPFERGAEIQFARDGFLKNDDVVCFVDSGNGPKYCHAGKVRQMNGENWVVSKCGQSPLFVAPVQTAGRPYNKMFNEVRVYRLKRGTDASGVRLAQDGDEDLAVGGDDEFLDDYPGT